MALTGQEARVLVIGPPAAAAEAFEPAAAGRHLHVVPPGAATAGSQFDAVALPGGLLDESVPGPGDERPLPASLLRQAHDALRPGGVLVGHCYHLLSAHGLRQTFAGRVSSRTWIRGRGLRSGAGCLRTLKELGFIEVECYYVEPRIDAPMALIPLHAMAARSHFFRAIRRTRGQYSGLGFALRMVLAAFGLGGLLQPHLFFWARRPC